MKRTVIAVASCLFAATPAASQNDIVIQFNPFRIQFPRLELPFGPPPGGRRVVVPPFRYTPPSAFAYEPRRRRHREWLWEQYDPRYDPRQYAPPQQQQLPPPTAGLPPPPPPSTLQPPQSKTLPKKEEPPVASVPFSPEPTALEEPPPPPETRPPTSHYFGPEKPKREYRQN